MDETASYIAQHNPGVSSMSPTWVSDYKLCLPDKEALQAKLREVTDIALEQADK
jgi:hypothetical protein